MTSKNRERACAVAQGMEWALHWKPRACSVVLFYMYNLHYRVCPKSTKTAGLARQSNDDLLGRSG